MQKIKIPFVNGEMVSYSDAHTNKNAEWIDNYKFTDTLKIDDYSRGNSSAKFILKSQTKRYEMFLVDMLHMLNNANINTGFVKGTFTFVKRGKNFGIKFIG